MSKTDEFWEFAREAILLACNAEVDEDKQVCFTLREPGRKRRYWSEQPLVIATAAVRSAPHEPVSVGGIVFKLHRQIEPVSSRLVVFGCGSRSA